ncbi:Phosphoglucomutase/phosphomannomutase [Oceanicola granulosus HTCC2516]|uniref:Phosphoglucomutase/phosphomannomutase n=1 Tax=Oceanicola granulosus (strain ATCC BAA-861 / DSM 15982 / KCTC 12143 / HTCC2516) TaxID=314256 RepID=Q2CBU5_OCEGH|nr:phosphomannomutase [Oceanicola granulosus]EAR50109.1 Phosphoglucomutase/phosphomannomutase [Oceanicola granulosus HTCC2516]
MAPKFGTSGLRGLVVEMTDALVADHVTAFLAACDTGGRVCVGRDLRPSSPAIAATVVAALRAAGATAIECGALPTPALALAAQAHGAGAVMVTGSHIPADRNGLKFYTRAGEITKADEAAITAALGTAPEGASGESETDPEAAARFGARYVTAYRGALAGRRVGVYSHSAVGRDLLAGVLSGCGAEVVELARSEDFIPVDTEAVDPATRTRLAAWAAEHRLDAIASTDGDSDRPMLTDETGRVIPGDVLGQITAAALEASVVVTPISSNSGVTAKGFGEVIHTRIGSPYVIAAMEDAGGDVAGYEANGGFLLGFPAQGSAGPLPPLATRDAFLPILAPLAAAGTAGLAALVAAEPPRFTAADRLQGIPTERSRAAIETLRADPAARAAFLAFAGEETGLDETDGLRMTLADTTILHLRPSGNAPECRLYVEADSQDRAEALLAEGLERLGTLLG